jgi:hypothetical protein
MSNHWTRCNGLEYFYGLSIPIGLSVQWIDDFARLTWIDIFNGQAQYEIWESKNGSSYTFVAITAFGAVTYDNYTEQNANMQFAIKARQFEDVSDFSNSVSLTTPLVFKLDQSILIQIKFHYFRITPGHSITIEWGDGNTDTYVGWTPDDSVLHDYLIIKNPYFVKFTGEVDRLSWFEYIAQLNAYGDLSKWNLPVDLAIFHFYNHSFNGNISNWMKPFTNGINIFHVGGNAFTGDLSEIKFPVSLWDFHLEGNFFNGDISKWTFHSPWRPFPTGTHISIATNNFTGDISGWIMPVNLTWLDIHDNNLTGNLSGWNIPLTLSNIQLTANIVVPQDNHFTGDISAWIFANAVDVNVGFLIWLCFCNISGDLSGAIIPLGHPAGTNKELVFRECNLTKLPRGAFEDIDIYNFNQNNCNAAEIENILHDIDNHFVAGVVPLNNCLYDLSGVGMAVANAAALAHKASIIAKYIAAGFVATINVN